MNFTGFMRVERIDANPALSFFKSMRRGYRTLKTTELASISRLGRAGLKLRPRRRRYLGDDITAFFDGARESGDVIHRHTRL
jgi:hypothetical protein